jgi:hypothetical protein
MMVMQYTALVKWKSRSLGNEIRVSVLSGAIGFHRRGAGEQKAAKLVTSY